MPSIMPTPVHRVSSSPRSSHQSSDYRRDSGLAAATKQSQFGENMASPMTSPPPRFHRYSLPQPVSQTTNQSFPRAHRSSTSQLTSKPLPSHPRKHRDSVIEPDAYATFTSTSAATAQPTIYKPGFPSPLKVTKYAVHDSLTGNALITISRNAVHMPEPFSSKPLLNLTKSDTGVAVGSIRFHLVSSTIDLELSGVGSSRMGHDGHFSKRWKFSSFFDRSGAQESLYWCQSKKEGGWELKEGGKKGGIVARIDMGDGMTIKFERAGLGERDVEEVVVSAVALLENLRRSDKEMEWGELGSGAGGPHAIR